MSIRSQRTVFQGSLSCSLPGSLTSTNKEVEKVIGRTKKCGVQRTEYQSTTLWGSLSHCKTSPRQRFHKYDCHEHTIPYAALPLRLVHNMTLGAASRRVNFRGQVGRLCPKSTLLGRKQEHYVGYAVQHRVVFLQRFKEA